jgi:hypothetical protein
MPLRLFTTADLLQILLLARSCADVADIGCSRFQSEPNLLVLLAMCKASCSQIDATHESRFVQGCWLDER